MSRSVKFGVRSMNSALVNAEYAVRGPIVAKAAQIMEGMKKEPGKFPFKNVIHCNIGNPQALNQKPIRFYRDVSALLASPWMLDDPEITKRFKPDVLRRARDMVTKIGHNNMTGAYTESKGYAWVRENVARALELRDGVPADPSNIFLTDGASPGIKLVLNCLIANEGDAVMLPIPQYPLYSASLTTFNGAAAPYYLDESMGWNFTVNELTRSYNEAKAAGKNVRALVVINPGNPTGQVLDPDTMMEIVEFARERDLMLLADEVYQENIYGEKKFVSFKSLVGDKVPLASFHSVSKGVIAECGKRGGYMEVHNLDPDVKALLEKVSSISLCPNVTGQILTDLMMNPPVPGDESYEEFHKEHTELLESLKKRALILSDAINKIDGMRTNPIEGSMYAFPSITLPQKFIDEAKAANMEPDAHWAMKLLEATGIVVVPGSGFGQVPGTYHFRITILPPEEMMLEVVKGLAEFHTKIMKEYS
eukprot:TRINITY_DN701_c0_g1_i1.p1 TRINITY_DN701_c0_g1~~TRINITY_DN701_c0_g1_i1.p1  ORF type:complete len:478 (+),score=136.55 TRINITY_DN701_c0_g1_i1:51-1484(+)